MLKIKERLKVLSKIKQRSAHWMMCEAINQYVEREEKRESFRMNPEYRELVIGFGHHGYVALYRLDGGSAIVVAIRHQLEAGYEENNG